MRVQKYFDIVRSYKIIQLLAQLAQPEQNISHESPLTLHDQTKTLPSQVSMYYYIYLQLLWDKTMQHYIYLN